MKVNLHTKNGNIQIEEPEINRLYEELTRLILLSEYWQDEKFKTLMKICIKARNRKKLIYGHETTSNMKNLNTFYTNKDKDNFSIFVTGAFVMINDKEVSPAVAYKMLVQAGVCNYRYNNVFGLKREGNIFSKYYKYILPDEEKNNKS